MSPARLIGELRLLGVEIHRNGDRISCRAAKGVLTPDHAHQLRELKPEILARLDAEEDAISWRVRYMLASDPSTFSLLNLPPKPGQCWSCEEPQPYGQDGKCVLCALAAVRVGRVVDGLDAPPEDEIVPVAERVRLPSWDCSCGANVVGGWSYCPVCQKPKREREQSIMEVAS